jgi:aminobenzoyl-glutamate transport protein
MSKEIAASTGWVNRFLTIIEKIGNALPHPATLFAGFALLVVILSAIFSAIGIEVLHPGNGEKISTFNLLSVDGMHKILTHLVTNFTGFAPLGTVLVALLGIGIAEGSGLIGTVLRLVVLKSPPRLLTFVIVLSGVISNAASEVGYVLLVPLAAVIFQAAGRNPLAGLAAAFAGVSGGYSANVLLGTVDPLLAGLSEEAAKIINPDYTVNPACNYYFMFASTFLISIIGTLITEKIIIPRLGTFSGEIDNDQLKPLNEVEKKGLLYALISIVAFIAIVLCGLLPENGFLREPGTGSILKSPFMKGIVSLIFVSAAVGGIFYGIGAKTIKNDNDVMKGMSKSMETLGSYIVLVFFAAQFVAFFNWSNIGLILAVKGAEALKAAGLNSVLLVVSFISVSALINLVMGSASAKWAIMAPVFIPMFMLLGYSPEFTQCAYRVGDSVTNIISPMMSYFALIVAFIQRYQKDAGLGTVISLMLPYSFIFYIVWSIFFVLWVQFDIPFGPGAGVFYQP